VPSRHSERFEAIQNGVLAYAGFDVMSPFYAWSVVQVGLDRRMSYLDEWEHRVSSMFSDEPELRAALGPTPQPPKLLGRVRKHGDRVYPYGGDCSLAGFAAVERLKAKPGFAHDLRSKLESLVHASRTDSSTRIYALLQSRDDADSLWLFQSFKDAEAEARHVKLEPYASILQEIEHLLAEPVEVIPLTPLLAKGL